MTSLLIGSSTLSPALAAETVGKDSDCKDATCLGVWDGLLADCPHNTMKSGAGCVSSQDDTPAVFAEPWDYSDSDTLDWNEQQRRLLPALEKVSRQFRDQFRLAFQDGRYTRVTFIDGKTSEESIGEFYFTLNDTTVQFRIASYSPNTSILSRHNMDRSEAIREELGYLKLPVLRNRRRTFMVGESELDTFGPGSAALGPPAEMTTGELEGIDRDVNPNLKIDLLQKFPYLR
jgi:uncharacterized protein (DUF1499 family)